MILRRTNSHSHTQDSARIPDGGTAAIVSSIAVRVNAEEDHYRGDTLALEVVESTSRYYSKGRNGLVHWAEGITVKA